MIKGEKYDGDKPRMSLIPPQAIIEISKVLTFGAHKYDDNNWQYVDNAKSRYADALLRHIFAWLDGEQTDPESGLHHLAHAGCNILFLLWIDANNLSDNND